MISSLRTWMFNKSVTEHHNYKNKPSRQGLNTCDSICLLANGTLEQNYIATENYQQKLSKMGKTVDVLYFFDQKQDNPKGYNRMAVKWNGVPEHETVTHVLSQQYDLMIYLSRTLEDHLRYIATLCSARFKIGPAFAGHEDLFHLMIDSPSTQNTKDLIDCINQQLKLISPKPSTA